MTPPLRLLHHHFILKQNNTTHKIKNSNNIFDNDFQFNYSLKMYSHPQRSSPSNSYYRYCVKDNLYLFPGSCFQFRNNRCHLKQINCYWNIRFVLFDLVHYKLIRKKKESVFITTVKQNGDTVNCFFAGFCRFV